MQVLILHVHLYVDVGTGCYKRPSSNDRLFLRLGNFRPLQKHVVLCAHLIELTDNAVLAA
jgi:hypothetical protein